MSDERTWNNVLEELKIAVSKAIFQTLFQNTRLVNIEKQIATIGCPSGYIQGLIETRYYSLIKEILDRQIKKDCSLVFVVKSLPANQKGGGPLFEEPTSTSQATGPSYDHHLRLDFTFANFAVSAINQLPYAAATAVAKNPGNSYNPLFVWGGVGVGKTHLMQAIGHEILKNKPSTKIIYCPGEEFTNEIVLAIKNKSTDQFKKKYRSVKVLLLDDVQFIAGKITVQEEFFHTFNAIQSVGGQVVLTSDRPPEEIPRLEERLKSRFQAGLTVDLPSPDFELRSAILLIKARQQGIELPMDLAQLIAGNIDSVRPMEGFLTKIVTLSQTRNLSITPELVQTQLGKAIEKGDRSKHLVKPKEVIQAVADYYQLKISQLKHPTRVKRIVVPRQVLMYLLRVEMEMPLVQVGQLLGGRDHTTVMHGVEKVTSLLQKDSELRVDIAGIKQKLFYQ